MEDGFFSLWQWLVSWWRQLRGQKMSADEVTFFIVKSWRNEYDARAIYRHLRNRGVEISIPLILIVIRRYINNQTENGTYRARHDS